MSTTTQRREPVLAAVGFSPVIPPGEGPGRPEGFLLYPGPVRRVFEAIAKAADQDGILAGKGMRDISKATELPLAVVAMAVRFLDRKNVLRHFYDTSGRSVFLLPVAEGCRIERAAEDPAQ